MNSFGKNPQLGRILEVGKKHSNYLGDYNRRANYPGSHSGFGGNGMSYAAGGGNGVAMSPTLKPIQITIQNTDTKTLSAPIFSAGEQLPTPFGGVADVNGVVAGSGVGIVFSYPNSTVTLQMIRATIIQKPFWIDSVIYTFPSTNQLDLNWTHRKANVSADYATSLYIPKDDQDLGNNITTKIQTKKFKAWVDIDYTLLIPVFASSIISLTFYIGADYDPTKVAQGSPAMTSFEMPNITVPTGQM